MIIQGALSLVATTAPDFEAEEAFKFRPGIHKCMCTFLINVFFFLTNDD